MNLESAEFMLVASALSRDDSFDRRQAFACLFDCIKDLRARVEALEARVAYMETPPKRGDEICAVCSGGPGNEGACLCGHKMWVYSDGPVGEVERMFIEDAPRHFFPEI